MQGTPELLRLLSEINPKKPYGTELFNALARLFPGFAIEAVCLRQIDDKTQVYLTQRLPNESAYPGEWHCPGSIFRPGEEFEDVFARLETREFGCQLATKKFVINLNNPTEARGHFLSVVHLCTMNGDGGHGQWFSVDELPEVTINFHRDRVIPAAVAAFTLANI